MNPTLRRIATSLALLALPLTTRAVEYDIQRWIGIGSFPLGGAISINAQGQIIGNVSNSQIGILGDGVLTTVTLPSSNPQIQGFSDSGVALLYDYSSGDIQRGQYYTFSVQGGLSPLPASVHDAVITPAGDVLTLSQSVQPGILTVTRPDGGQTAMQWETGDVSHDVNSSGIFVGSRGNDAAYWDASGQRHVLGTMGGWRAELYTVTDSGLAMGYRYLRSTDDQTLPTRFIYSLADGEVRFLDGLYSGGIDEAGRIYGSILTADNQLRAVMWEDGQLTRLDDLLRGYPVSFVRSISSDGRILMSSSLQTSWFLLTPVPEPGTYALTGIGLAAAAWGARRRRAGAA